MQFQSIQNAIDLLGPAPPPPPPARVPSGTSDKPAIRAASARLAEKAAAAKAAKPSKAKPKSVTHLVSPGNAATAKSSAHPPAAVKIAKALPAARTARAAPRKAAGGGHRRR